MKKLILFVVCLVMATGCATQSQQAKTEGTGIGAGLGAAIGAGLGFAIGGDGKAAAIGAGVGALLGGSAGYVYANNIDQQHQELLSKENDVDGQIQVAQKINSELVQANQNLESQLAGYDRDIATLKKQAKRESGAKKKLLATKQKIDQNRADVQKALVSAKSTLTDMEKLRAENKTPSSDLDAEIIKLKTTYSALQKNSTKLASLSQRI